MRNKMAALGAGLLFLAWSVSPSLAGEYEDLKAEMRALKSRVAELEAKVEQYERKDVEMHAHHEHEGHGHDHHQGFDIELGHQHHHMDIHNIQIHGGLDFRWLSTENSEQKLFLHEAELGVGAKLSDWMDGLITFTKHHGEEVEIEQAYGKLKFEEIQSAVKAGKFFVNFGPENRVGFYDRRTVTPSAMREGFFGHENWSDEGAEVAVKLPVEFESVVTVAALNGNNAATFGDGTNTVDNNNILAAVNLHNAFETSIGDFTAGASYAGGKWDDDDDYEAHLYGLDAGWKKGPWELQGEYMYREKDSTTGGTVDGDGFYVFGAYTKPINWKYLRDVEFLFAYGESDPDETTKEKRYSPQISFGLTENSKIRLIYDFREESPVDVDNDRFIAQFAYHF